MITCKYCQKEYQSYKSWHRHKTLKHADKIGDPFQMQKDYAANPKLCEKCSEPIPYKNKNGNTCSRSCGASLSNSTRDSVAEKLRDSWRKKNGMLRCERPKPPRKIWSLTENVLKECETCGAPFKVMALQQRFCKPSCNISKSGKVNYRLLCRFKLNKNDHPTLFDGNLIRLHGWYCSASKKTCNPKQKPYNPEGVTWDHLYRIQDGFKNHIDPVIMSHPANAELIPWRENTGRKHSMITYEELLHRIELWNSGRQSELVYFYNKYN
jgi:hypothetical protein